MAARLIVSPEAVEDIVEACRWYENRRPGLGEDFLDRIDACIQTIRRMPEVYPIVFEDYRRGLLRRFPFAVIYDYIGGTVTIYGVFHTSRDQEKWRQRLP